jgi:trimeric autotransporter adhesin
LTLTDAEYPNETFPIVINENTGSSDVNTITIKPAIGISPIITCNTSKSVFILNGSDYVIFDGSNQVGGNSKDLTISNTFNGDISNSVISIEDNGTKAATNITVANCIIKGTPTVTSSFGIFSTNDLGRNFLNISILNNTIKNAKIGIQIADANNNIISGNIFGDDTEPLTQGGIEISFCDNTLITENDIFGTVAGNPTENQFGVLIGSNATNSKITKNKIHDFSYTGSNGVACWGIKYNAESSSLSEISNNLIYNIKSDGDRVSGGAGNVNWIPSGILILTGGNLQIYYNSINMTGNILGTGPFSNFAGNSACLVINADITNLDIRNNIFKNSMTTVSGTGENTTFGVVSYSTNTAFSDINYNDYYIDGINPKIGYLSVDQSTLTDWQAATSNDANSISADPGFVSDTDLHPTLSGPNNNGIIIPGVTTDYANITRSNPPDIGAYEYSVLTAGISDIVAGLHVSAYPNPNHGHFTLSINSPNREAFSLRILNTLGILVYERKALEVDGILNVVVDLQSLPLGMYSVILNTVNHQVIRKIVIN